MSERGAAGGPRLSDRQRISWLRLIRTENVGPATWSGASARPRSRCKCCPSW